MIARETVYIYQELDAAGEKVGGEREFNLAGVRLHVSIVAVRYKLSDLDHMIGILHAAHAKGFRGNPVDLILWNKEKTALTWSARLWIKSTPEERAATVE